MALLTVLAAGASAQVTISGGAALSTMEGQLGSGSAKGDIGFGGNVYVDYLLPIGIPLSLGFEAGYDTASITTSLEENEVKVTGNVIPLLLRVAYHLDLMANLDLYVVGKVGYILGFGEVEGESESGFNGLGFGVDVGAAYYLHPRFGLFIEGGFDRYNAEKEWDLEDMGMGKIDVKAPFTRFVTLGFSTKF
jgi:hypothetical protein